MPTSNHQPQPTVDKYKGPKHMEPPRHESQDLQRQPDPDVENFAEVGDNVQKSMDQALEFQNPDTRKDAEKGQSTETCPLLLTYHH